MQNLSNYKNVTIIAFVLLILPSVVFSLGVVSLSPTPQTIVAPVNSVISITFDSPIDTNSVNSASFRLFGRWSGPASGQYSFLNSNKEIQFTLDKDLFYGEWVTVSLSRNVLYETGDSLIGGYAWNFWTMTKPGTMDYTLTKTLEIKLQGETFIQSYGAYAGDLNHDGWTDLAIPNEQTNDIRIFLNDKTGDYNSFSVTSIPGGSSPSTNEGADFNNDGITDFAVGNGGNNLMSCLIGVGNGGFWGATNYVAGNSVRGICVMDLNSDGWDDIVTANRSASYISLFINKKDGTFEPAVNMEVGGTGETSCAVADANNDGIMDLFVGTYSSRKIHLLLGDGNGNLIFSDSTFAGGTPWMIVPGDINGDGNVDIAAVGAFSSNANVILGDGNGGLLPRVSYPTGSFSLAIDLGDIDGDGDLDLVTSNYSGANWTIYENDATGVYINQRTLNAYKAGSCATLHDRDNDGDLDLSGIDEIDDVLFLFTNYVNCCDMAGDMNNDGNENISDLTFHVEYLFKGGDAPSCFEEGDVNGDCEQNIADLTFRVAYMFRSGPPLECTDCP